MKTLLKVKKSNNQYELKVVYMSQGMSSDEQCLDIGTETDMLSRKLDIENNCYCKDIYNSFCDFCTGLRNSKNN